MASFLAESAKNFAPRQYSESYLLDVGSSFERRADANSPCRFARSVSETYVAPIQDWTTGRDLVPRSPSSSQSNGWVTIEETHVVGTPAEIVAKANELLGAGSASRRYSSPSPISLRQSPSRFGSSASDRSLSPEPTSLGDTPVRQIVRRQSETCVAPIQDWTTGQEKVPRGAPRGHWVTVEETHTVDTISIVLPPGVEIVNVDDKQA